MNDRTTKNHKEIFTERFPLNDVESNPYVATEAMGYLEALEQFLPTDEWIKECKKKIVKVLIKRVIKEMSDGNI